MSKTDVHIPGLSHDQMCPNSDSDILKKNSQTVANLFQRWRIKK